MNKIVNKELALLLLEKEYSQERNIGDIFRITNKINPLYEKTRELEDDDLHNEWAIINEKYPLLCDVIIWLYEKHNIWIGVTLTTFDKFKYDIRVKIHHQISDAGFNSPIKSYEQAVLYTIKNLI